MRSIEVIAFTLLSAGWPVSSQVSGYADDGTCQAYVQQLCESLKPSNTRSLPLSSVEKTDAVDLSGGRRPLGPRNFLAGLEGSLGETSYTAFAQIVKEQIHNVLDENLIGSCSDRKARKSDDGTIDDIRYSYIPFLGLLKVLCSYEDDGKGWTVFHRRFDGSISFDRNWFEFATGFGDLNGEFWLGLEKVYQLMKNGDHELRIDMVLSNGTRLYAEYGSFNISSSSDYYRLSVGQYSGNSTDGMTWYVNNPNHRPFTTKDADHDKWSKGNCAARYHGGWWHNDCFLTNLNAVFASEYFRWYDQNRDDYMELHSAEMKFRRKA